MFAWLNTSTFYGNWLPGDPRGFVSRVRDRRPEDPTTQHRVKHATPGTEYDRDQQGLWISAKNSLKAAPIRIDTDQARIILEQFQQTALYRHQKLWAVSLMANHIHWIVELEQFHTANKLLQDYKSYASRKLNSIYGKPASGSWWTSGGSTRHLQNQQSLHSAIKYVLNQHSSLITWAHPDYAQFSEMIDTYWPS